MAIEEIERKVAALRAVMVAEPVDMKILQMQIQGTVSLQVCVCVCVLIRSPLISNHRNQTEPRTHRAKPTIISASLTLTPRPPPSHLLHPCTLHRG